MEEKQAVRSGSHKILMDNRKKGSITGVADVISFDLKEILLETTMGMLTIKGQDLKVTRLSVEKGEVDLTGQIDSMTYTYSPKGVCSSRIDLELENGVIRSVAFTGGCNGNLKGVCALLKGMTTDEAIARIRGITCGPKSTSCPDQISYAIEQAVAESK